MPERLFPETVSEKLSRVRTRLVEDVIKAKKAIETAGEKLDTAETLVREFDEAMAQQAEQERTMLIAPPSDFTEQPL
jgi:hypothetical protein